MYKMINDFCNYTKNKIAYCKSVKGKYGALFCEECGEYTIFKVTFKTKYLEDNDFSCRVHFSFTCPHCGHYNDDIDEYYMYDPNIAHTIYLLNKKNYITKACCEGHDGRAYILFGQNEYKQVLDKFPLPYPWYTDTDIGASMDFINPRWTIRANLDIPVALDNIEQWAKDLPEWKDPVNPENGHEYFIETLGDAILL